jgi:putative ABC transport system permease protein
LNLKEALRIALHGLRANRLRSVLTMLGIIIGVAAVILLVAIGNGVQASVNAEIQPLANLITIVPSAGKVPGGAPPKDLIDGDVTALEKQVIDAAAIIPATTGQALVATASTKYRSGVIGSTERWLEVNNRDVQLGSFFSGAQVRSAARVVVLGPTVASTLFGDTGAALGQTVRINHQAFKVIGVMQSLVSRSTATRSCR